MIFSGKERRKRVGLFGGSFNPPHLGHSVICRWLFAQDLVDELWMIPCFIHPFGKELLPFEDRLAMCRLAFTKLGPKVQVTDVEQRLGGTSYTLRTVEHLKAGYPDFRFSLVTGGDVSEEASGWREFDRIREQVEIIRIPRGQGSPIPDISSTEVRRRLDAREPFADLVEKEVAVYIVTKNLFR
ncbi:MAG: nicotinate-nicotinamide nucleotide adenylyltransferase [Pseudomonadota bacterium]